MTKIAVLGTGDVGQRLATACVRLGHDVAMGSRTADNPKAAAWAAEHGAAHGTFADAAQGAELVVVATAGEASRAALDAVGAEALHGTVVVDVTNPLDFSRGFPPSVTVPEEGSLGEHLQAAFPEARVVKTLNTMNNSVMVDPGRVPGRHHVFLCGNDAGAKAQVAALLGEFGWTPDRILDLGDISGARGTEQLMPLWLRLYGALGTGDFNFAVAGPTAD